MSTYRERKREAGFDWESTRRETIMVQRTDKDVVNEAHVKMGFGFWILVPISTATTKEFGDFVVVK